VAILLGPVQAPIVNLPMCCVIRHIKRVQPPEVMLLWNGVFPMMLGHRHPHLGRTVVELTWTFPAPVAILVLTRSMLESKFLHPKAAAPPNIGLNDQDVFVKEPSLSLGTIIAVCVTWDKLQTAHVEKEQ